jgi:hypothetical protein
MDGVTIFNSAYLFSGRRISLPRPFTHLFRPYPTLHTYSVVVEYRYPIPSLIFFVPTQLSLRVKGCGSDNRRQLNKNGELGKDEKDEGWDGDTIFGDY